MFDIEQTEEGVIRMVGRLDAAAAIRLERFLIEIESSAIVDFEALDYISSGGFGELFAAQKRLKAAGEALTLRNLNPHIRELFAIAGFDAFFDIE